MWLRVTAYCDAKKDNFRSFWIWDFSTFSLFLSIFYNNCFLFTSGKRFKMRIFIWKKRGSYRVKQSESTACQSRESLQTAEDWLFDVNKLWQRWEGSNNKQEVVPWSPPPLHWSPLPSGRKRETWKPEVKPWNLMKKEMFLCRRHLALFIESLQWDPVKNSVISFNTWEFKGLTFCLSRWSRKSD